MATAEFSKFAGMLSEGATDVMLRVDALTNFTQQALQDSQKVLKVFQLLMLNKHKLEGWPYKTD